MADTRKRVVFILFGLLVAVSSPVASAAAKDVPLTQDSVTRFLASFAEMRAIALSEGAQAGMNAESSKNPIGAIVKAVKSSKLQAQAQDISLRHGFQDFKEWSDTGVAIGQAYLYITAGPTRGMARETLDKNKGTALAQLDKLGLLNDKQKERLKEKLDDFSAQLGRKPSPQNIAVVEEMKLDIEAAVKLGLN